MDKWNSFNGSFTGTQNVPKMNMVLSMNHPKKESFRDFLNYSSEDGSE
jgi:hypothetical protein